MTRRRLLLFAAAACLLVAGPFVVRWVTTPAPVAGVTLENFRRLHRGMDLKEMEAILGRPADRTQNDAAGVFYVWTGDEGRILIRINIDQPWLQQGPHGVFQAGDVRWPLAQSQWPEPFYHKIRRWLSL